MSVDGMWLEKKTRFVGGSRTKQGVKNTKKNKKRKGNIIRPDAPGKGKNRKKPKPY